MAIMSIMVSEAANVDQTVTNGNQSSGQLDVGLQNTDTLSLANKTTEFYKTGNYTNSNNGNGVFFHEESISPTLDRTFLITMIAGIILVIMSVLRLSKVVVFIPVSCISGFTTAAAFHILTSQVKFILGITIVGHKGIFKFVKLWKEVILQIHNTNLCDLIIFFCCFIFLVSIKEIINPKFKHKLPMPIPAEIIVVIVVTLISYVAALSDNYGIRIVEQVPCGFMPPNIPDFQGFESYLTDAFLIAVISFVISYSMISTFARKHKYEVDASQEMLAYGMYHLIGSLFGGFAATAAPPRCTVLDTTGAKTQMVHVFTLLILLLTVLFIGPLFEPLPNSCLSTIIICALMPLFRQFHDLVQFWKINKYDFAIWLVTWASVLFLDIDIGLAIGIGFSITTIAVQACFTKGQTLSMTGHIDLHKPSKMHELSQEIPGIKIFRFNSDLHFVNHAQFKDELFRLILSPTKLASPGRKETKKKNSDIKTPVKKDSNGHTTGDENLETKQALLVDIYAIIIDFSSISYIDIMGLNLIKQLKADYSHVCINLVLANCSDAIVCKLQAAGTATRGKSKGGKEYQCEIDIFPTIQDAITALKK